MPRVRSRDRVVMRGGGAWHPCSPVRVRVRVRVRGNVRVRVRVTIRSPE